VLRDPGADARDPFVGLENHLRHTRMRAELGFPAYRKAQAQAIGPAGLRGAKGSVPPSIQGPAGK